MNRSSLIIAVVAIAAAINPASAQDMMSTPYDGALAAAIGGMNQMGAAMQGYEAQITQGAMADPQVQAAYRHYLAQGGWQDFATWAFNYRATNGYDPNAVRQVYNQQFANTAAEAQAWNGVRAAEAGSAAAIGGWQSGYAADQNEAGLAMQGQRTYGAPDGDDVQLGYMPSAGTTYDPNAGVTYVPNGDGSYTAYDANGYGTYVPY